MLFSEQALLKEATGKVEIQLPGKPWAAAKQGMTLPQGAAISTGFNSTAVLDLGTSVLQVRPLTRMKIEELVEKEGVASTKLNLQLGRVKAEVKTTEGIKHDFTIKSSVSTAAVRGTEFEYDGEQVIGFSGAVNLANLAGQTTSVTAGEQAVASGYQPPTSSQAVLEAQTNVSVQTGEKPAIPVKLDIPVPIPVTPVTPVTPTTPEIPAPTTTTVTVTVQWP